MSRKRPQTSLVTRPPRVVPVSLLALALVALGGLGCWLLITYLVEDAWPAVASDQIGSTAQLAITDAIIQGVAVGILVVGVVLILIAVIPGKPSRVRVLDDDVAGETVMARRDVAKRLEKQAETIDGVHSVSSEYRGRRVDVAVRSVVDDTEPVLRAATDAVTRAVDELRPEPRPDVRVRAHQRS